jgi:hypothetical protein
MSTEIDTVGRLEAIEAELARLRGLNDPDERGRRLEAEKVRLRGAAVADKDRRQELERLGRVHAAAEYAEAVATQERRDAPRRAKLLAPVLKRREAAVEQIVEARARLDEAQARFDQANAEIREIERRELSDPVPVPAHMVPAPLWPAADRARAAAEQAGRIERAKRARGVFSRFSR